MGKLDTGSVTYTAYDVFYGTVTSITLTPLQAITEIKNRLRGLKRTTPPFVLEAVSPAGDLWVAGGRFATANELTLSLGGRDEEMDIEGRIFYALSGFTTSELRRIVKGVFPSWPAKRVNKALYSGVTFDGKGRFAKNPLTARERESIRKEAHSHYERYKQREMSGDIPPLGAYESGVAMGIDAVTRMPLAFDIRQKKKKMKEEQYQRLLEKAKREGKRVGIPRLVGDEMEWFTPILPIDPEDERIREQMLKSVSAGEVGPSRRRGRSSRDYELQSYPVSQAQWPPKRFTSNPLTSREFAALGRLHQSYVDEAGGKKSGDLRVKPRRGDFDYGYYEGMHKAIDRVDAMRPRRTRGAKPKKYHKFHLPHREPVNKYDIQPYAFPLAPVEGYPDPKMWMEFLNARRDLGLAYELLIPGQPIGTGTLLSPENMGERVLVPFYDPSLGGLVDPDHPANWFALIPPEDNIFNYGG